MSGAEFAPIGTVPERVEWRAACVLAQDAQGHFLMQLRDDIVGIAGPGQWSLFGGAVEPGETLIGAAIREFAEETAVTIAPDDLKPLCLLPSQIRANGAIYVYQMIRPLARHDIRLREGAGFAFLSIKQTLVFDLIPNFARMFKELPDLIAKA